MLVIDDDWNDSDDNDPDGFCKFARCDGNEGSESGGSLSTARTSLGTFNSSF